MVVAVIPLKALRDAKGRLADTLTPEARTQLVSWMFHRVASACAGAEVDDILVVAGDTDAAALARDLGLTTVVETRPGLRRAIGVADSHLAGADATVVVAADLPLVTSAEVDAICAAGRQAPAVVVAATHDGGTGALLRRPPQLISPRFGPNSADEHLAAARAAGARACRLDLAGLRLDVDTADSLEALEAAGAPWPGTRRS